MSTCVVHLSTQIGELYCEWSNGRESRTRCFQFLKLFRNILKENNDVSCFNLMFVRMIC